MTTLAKNIFKRIEITMRKSYTGWAAESGKKWTFSMYRPASFTYAFGSPEKDLMVYVRTLATNLGKKNATFLDGDVQAAA
jgi:TPP-dependent pyruvate/acetoin dehydrogenase alpha subunit